MVAQVFVDEELERLREFPEVSRDDLVRFFTLTSTDLAFVDPGRGRGPGDRLGLSLALCALPWLGFVPDDVRAAPPVAVARLAAQLQVDPSVLRSYGRREKTRQDHLRLAAQYLGWHTAASLEFKELDEFLLARAMEHDSPTLLFRLACEYLISAKVIRPGPIVVVKRVAHAREEAQRETYDRLAAAFTPERCAALDELLVTDPDVGMTRLRWLGRGPVEASPAAVRAEVGKLEFLRGLGAHELDLSVLPAERRRFLATMGRRLTGQALQRRDPQRRYPILLTVLAQSAVDVLDEVVSLFDQAVSAREGKAERSMRDALAERGRVGEDRQELLDAILVIVADPAVPDEEVGGLIRGDRIGWARLRAAQSSALPRLPRDHGHLAALAAGSYGYLRQFTLHVLDAVTFTGGTASADLLAAVEILRALNASGARRVPAGAPTGFVPARWRGYLDTTAPSGSSPSSTSYRRYWELCVLLALRDGLRSGDVFVPGSRRYSDPAAYLLTPDQWAGHRAEFCRLVGKPADPARVLAAAGDELAQALDGLEQVLASGDGPVRLDEAGDLVISPLSAEDVPAEAIALKAELTAMLPFAPIVSLLIELDKRTGFLDEFTHATGKQARSPELKRNLIGVLLAHSTNLGLSRMADACGISIDVLTWTSEWYVREETLRAANLAIIRHHQRMPLAAVFGTGTLSSSDGQRFPVRGKTTTGREMTIYGGQVLSTYTHVTDQHTTYGTKIIVATRRAGAAVDAVRGPLRARRDPRQRHRSPDHRTRYGHARRDLGQLRALRPARIAAVPEDPGPGQAHPLPRRLPRERGGGVPERRPAADPPPEHRADRRALRRPAAPGRVVEVRARHRVAAGRKALGLGPAERARRRAQGVRGVAAHDLRRSLPRRSGVSAQDLPPAQQGRIPARAQARPPVCPRRHRPGAAPRAADRAGVVPHPDHQRGHRVDHGVLRARGRVAAPRRPTR